MKKSGLLILIFAFSFSFYSCTKKGEMVEKESKQTSENKPGAEKNINSSVTSPFHVKYESKQENEFTIMELWSKGNNFKMEVNTKRGENKDISIMYSLDKIAYTITDIAGEKMNMKAEISPELENTMNFEITNVFDKLKNWQKVGSEDVLGYKCDIYLTKMGDKISIYKDNYVLKIVDKNNMTYNAVVYEPEIKLADDFFQPPKNLEYMRMEDM